MKAWSETKVKLWILSIKGMHSLVGKSFQRQKIYLTVEVSSKAALAQQLKPGTLSWIAEIQITLTVEVIIISMI